MEKTTLRFWNGNGLLVVIPRDLRATSLIDGSECRIYAAAASLEGVIAMIAAYHGKPATTELIEQVQKRWIRGGWPKVMDGKAREPCLWLDYGPVFGKEVTQLWPTVLRQS